MSDRKSLGWFSHFGWGPAQGQECTLGHAKETVRIAGSLMRCCTPWTHPRILTPTTGAYRLQLCESPKPAIFYELFRKMELLFLPSDSFLSTRFLIL